jgi:hypothetical protein
MPVWASALRKYLNVLQYFTMGRTITIRLTKDLADWLENTAKKTGVPQGKIIREQLDRARKKGRNNFMRLAGSVSGPRNLSLRKGFSRS